MKLLKYIEFLNEGLIKTQPMDIVLSKISLPKNLIYNISKNDNSIYLEILYFDKLTNIYETFGAIESYFVNMMGWFPSTVEMTNLSGMVNKMQFNLDYLVKNMNFISSIVIKYESKFDIESEIPSKLYHLSIQEFENSIMNKGLSPKSKITYHDSRIYVCKHLDECKNLIPNMKMVYNYQLWTYPKSKLNIKYIIYEIETEGLDLKLYKDPNYPNGFYILENIPKENIKVIEKEN